MACTPEAVEVLRKSNVLLAPAVAAGAGGVDFHNLHYVYMHTYIYIYYTMHCNIMVEANGIRSWRFSAKSN